jgi:hypothetical protein
MRSEKVPETSVIFNQLTSLIAQDDLINFSRREASDADDKASRKYGQLFVPFT